MSPHLFRMLLTLAVLSSFGFSMAAAQPVTSISFGTTTNAEEDAYRVSEFTVKGLWTGPLQLPLAKGDLWTSQKQDEVFAAIHKAFEDDPLQNFIFQQTGEIGVFSIDVKEEKNETAHTVKLTFRPLQVRLALAKVGDNVLPIPRLPSPARFEAVPRPLLAFNPTFGVTYDRAFGTAVGGGISSDLLALPGIATERAPATDNNQHLNARFSGAKSLETFYRAAAGLEYLQRHPGETLQDFFLSAAYDGANEPLAGQKHVENNGRAGAGFTLAALPHTRITFNSGYSHADDVLETSFSRTRTKTEIQFNRLLAESLFPQPVGGFFRAAIWEDNGRSDQGLGAHQRIVARMGYAREFAVAPNQTIGLELIAGAGKLFGDAPASRRFFGGNEPGQFLYDARETPGLVAMPTGPLIRSFGEGQAVGAGASAQNGGDGFWHVNLNLTVPIRPLSFPLIPQDDEVRGMLKNGINVSGRNFLISALKQQGFSRADAIAEADRTLNEVGPATRFIIDEANFFALKPLLMFDAGGLTGAGGDATWTAVGGGLQLTIVTAKFEAGYMHTLSGPLTGDRGNVFVRLVFQNLF